MLALAVCSAVALGAFLPEGESGPGSSLDATAGTVEVPRIQIQHDVVRIPVTEVNTVAEDPAEPPEPSIRRGARVRTEAGRPLLRVDGRREDGRGDAPGLVHRAVRTLVGDGRYKPQPFPTPPR